MSYFFVFQLCNMSLVAVLGSDLSPLKLTKDVKLNHDVLTLQQELDKTRFNLQTSIEDLETSNEELKSSNEELQSTNEELQSTNEELETSKEELQSLNEESTTVNAELQSRIDELSQTNDDIKNLLNSTQIATLFLDTELKIRRFTPQMTNIISLLPTDINRPIDHFSSCLHNIKLTDHANQVLKTLDKIEIEVSDDKDRYYKMRVLPYRTSNNVIDGIVISFEDVSTLKSVEMSLRKNEQRYKSLFENCPVAVLEIDNSRLVDFVTTHQLKRTEQIKAFLTQYPDKKTNILLCIKALNINKKGLQLFDADNKEMLLSKIPQLLITQNQYLIHLLNMVAEQKEHTLINVSLNTLKGSQKKCTITSSIPRLENELNFKNCILTLVSSK